MASNWFVYMILADDGSLYTGVTTDPDRRFAEHQSGRGAKYFRGRQPVEVVYQEAGHTRSSACVRESEIKKMPRTDKSGLINRLSPLEP
jgi:putative endonuclease